MKNKKVLVYVLYVVQFFNFSVFPHSMVKYWKTTNLNHYSITEHNMWRIGMTCNNNQMASIKGYKATIPPRSRVVRAEQP